MVQIDLNDVNVVGFIVLLCIFVAGLVLRHRARRLRQRDSPRRPPPSAVTDRPSPADDASKRRTDNGVTVQPPTPSLKDNDAVRRRQLSGSPLCSQCQCSLVRCMCTITLYRPAAVTSDDVITNSAAAASENCTRPATSRLSPAAVNGDVTRRRSPSPDHRGTFGRSSSPSVGERYLTVTRCQTSRSRSPSAAVSGSRTNIAKAASGRRTTEVNSNILEFKSKMA